MSFEIIWQKIVEFAKMFYNYAMIQGESDFMLVNSDFLNGKNVLEESIHFFFHPFKMSEWILSNVPKETIYFFVGSFILMVMLAIFASDSFNILHPTEGIREWKSKISIAKVLIFAASVFSFHTFYKMLVDVFGGFICADASVRALECLGSYINPISIMIYAFTICTVKFRRQWFQAFMLGLAIFLTPAAMSFYGFTKEHIAIYSTAGAIAFAGGILYAVKMYKKCSPFITCFVLDVIYFVDKYFMISYSDEIKLISASSKFGKIKQYLACIQMDLIFALILLLVLLVYKIATIENVNVKKDMIFPITLAVFMAFAIIFGKTELRYQPDYEHAVALWEDKKYEKAITAFEGLTGYKDSEDYIDQCIEKINKRTYKQGIELMRKEKYEKAIDKFTSIFDYMDSAEKIAKCERKLLPKLAGTWHGTEGGVLVLKENGTCQYFLDSLHKRKGNWSVDDNNVIRISINKLGYEIYADLNDSYRTITMMVKSDSSEWDNEEFSKLINFNVDTKDYSKLLGKWKNSHDVVITLNEDGTCYYKDPVSEESTGTWNVDDKAILRINAEGLTCQFYALLTGGYNIDRMMMRDTNIDSDWTSEFVKQ